MKEFEEAYQGLNPAQRRAVDTTEGPVMVVAGPGTGKTQVLALRIANILMKSDVGADAVLCLTFTRSGVGAMKERLERYMGTDARKVHVTTFHSFATDLIEEHYGLLDFDAVPELLDETKAVLLVDELLHSHAWQYIRPRTNPAQYFGDLKQLISILKRERMSPQVFLEAVEQEVLTLSEDPESFSSRGQSKGALKKEVEKKIESLERTKEVVEFYRLYEVVKKERALMDYDDVLEYAVMLAEQSEDVRAQLREEYQYILVDEHQDSSGVQNAFLKAVWQGVDQPNIFVVGDDRQLIYGFSGASISYFEAFGELFGKAELITLSENYRSTDRILALADDLLQSTVSKESLRSNYSGETVPVGLFEYAYERDELLGASQYFKKRIAEGVLPEQCALLVPKNRHVRSAITLFKDQGLPVATIAGVSLFAQQETQSLIRVLRIVANPYDFVALGESLLDSTSGIAPLEAHAFLHVQKGKPFSLETLEAFGQADSLFAGTSVVARWGVRLRGWIESLTHTRISQLISTLGRELLVEREQSHESLLRSVEIVRSLLHSVTVWEEREGQGMLVSYLAYLDRLQEYSHDIPVASFDASHGIQVMTLHKSKGLEYECVWVAHTNEETLMGQKRMPFTLPERIKDHIASRDKESVKRELYVALTRAKRECVLSYATTGYDGRSLTPLEIIADIPKHHFVFKDAAHTEQELLAEGPTAYITTTEESPDATLEEVRAFVQERYTDTKVSVTLLNNFFACPWKWYFRNFLKLPEVKSTSLALGSAVHSTIEHILKAGKQPPLSLLTEIVEAELQKEGVSDPYELRQLSKDALTALGNWLEVYYPHLAKDCVSERSIQAKDDRFPHLSLYGKIDLTERFPDGAVVVTDFKTGSTKTSGVIERETDDGRLSDYMRQLAMYSYLIRSAEDKEVARSRLLFVEADTKDKHALYETHIDDEQIDLLVRDIREYDEALKSGEWVSRECQHKGYGAQTECEYCALAKMFKK